MNDKDERDFLAISEVDIFEEARDRLKIATESESDIRTRARQAIKFREGDQWDHDLTTTASAETPELTINLTDAMVRRVVNNIKQQRPRGKCHPVGDGADIQIAEVLNGIGRHVEYRSDASVAYDTAAEMAVTAGFGYWRILSEYLSPKSFDQDLRIIPIRNIFTVYMDPAALMPTASDANWCLVTVTMKRTEYRQKYPNAPNVAWTDVGRDEWRHDWEEKESIRLAEYFRIREIKDKLFLIRDSSGYEFTRFKDEMPHEETLRDGGMAVVGERESVRRQVEWFRLNGTEVVERKILPGSYIPIIRCEGSAVDIDGKIHRRGMVEAMQDPQRMVNYGEVAKIKRLGLAPQAPWIVAEGQLDGHPEWTNSNREPVVVLTYKPVTLQTDQGEVMLPPPQRQAPAQIEAGFAEFVQGMRSNLMAVAGMPNEPGVDMNNQVISGRAIQKRQFLSDQAHFQYYDNLTLAISHTWRIMLEWIPYYFSERRMQRIIGEDGVPQMVEINKPIENEGIKRVKNDLTIGRYDVVMDTGPGYETKREEGADTLIELVNSKLGEVVSKVGADLVFRSIDHPYMQELADRIASQTPEGLKKIMEGMPERARSVIQQLAAENQQLHQALQQVQVEAKFGLQKEQIRAATKVHDTETRAQTTAMDAALRSRTELAREEIAGGVELLGKHLDHAHRQAENLISTGEVNGRSNGSAG